jgi:hypothetical protein
MAVNNDPTYIVIPGYYKAYIGMPSAPGTLIFLGESVDDLEISVEPIKHPVYADRNGGRAGDPIEEQFLGERARCEFELSRWVKATQVQLLTHGDVLETAGAIPDAAMGALMRRDNCYRVCFIPRLDSSQAKNFPCAMVERNQILGGGTKHRILRMAFSFHRAPPDHIGNKDGVLYDQDVSGVPT